MIHKDGVDTWVPRAVCMDGHQIEEGDTDITVSSKFCEMEGLDG